MEGFKEKGKDLISEEYFNKCWNQMKGNKLLKVHFATWYEMTAPLVFFSTKHEQERGEEESDAEGSEDALETDDEEADGEDSDMESQDAVTRKICKRRPRKKGGVRTKAALATERTKRRKRSLERYGSGDLRGEGWQLNEDIYLVKDENHAINNWLNVEQINAKLRKSSYSSTDMKDYLNASNPFGGKMIQTLAQMKAKFQLEQQEVLEIYYYMASTGAQESKYELRHNDSEYVFMLTFTQMDVILELGEGNHYFIIPAR